MLRSGWARLREYFFKTAKYHLKGNIVWRKTGPRIPISLTRWTTRCVIILKNDGGHIISRRTKLWTTSSCSLLRLDGLIALWEIVFRNAHSFMIVARTLADRIPLSAIGINCVINTWQSWDFTCAISSSVASLYSKSSLMGSWYCSNSRTYFVSLPY